jgi:F-type H+-transporting ATPase subunit epsilon
MATFHFELVSPERLLFSGEVDQVDVPGAEGDFGVLAGHAPLVAMLKPGILTVFAGGAREQIVVFGGFAEVSPTGMTVLADNAVALENLDAARLAAAIKEAEEDAADAGEEAQRDRLRRKLEQLRAVQAAVAGGGASQAAAH